MSLYEKPEIYDLAFGWDPTIEVNFYEKLIRIHCSNARRILEVGCGTGRLILEFARRGYEAYGLDLSHNMVRYALEKARRMNIRVLLFVADMVKFNMATSVDVVLSALSTFRHIVNLEDVKMHLETIYNILNPGGIYILDLYIVNPQNPSWKNECWKLVYDRLTVECLWSYLAKPNLKDMIAYEGCTIKVKFKGGRVVEFRDKFKMRIWTFKAFKDLTSNLKLFSIDGVYDGRNFITPCRLRHVNGNQRVIIVLKRK